VEAGPMRTAGRRLSVEAAATAEMLETTEDVDVATKLDADHTVPVRRDGAFTSS
jgi:hypothetical protein